MLQTGRVQKLVRGSGINFIRYVHNQKIGKPLRAS